MESKLMTVTWKKTVVGFPEKEKRSFYMIINLMGEEDMSFYESYPLCLCYTINASYPQNQLVRDGI